jgi:ABC-type xylose transport system permease subunit
MSTVGATPSTRARQSTWSRQSGLPDIGRIIAEMSSLAVVLLIVAVALLVLLPTRRLFLAGWSSPALTAYFLIVVALALFVAELRGPARYLIPILVVAYVAPFVTARDGIARLHERIGGGPDAAVRRPRSDPSRSARNVTPPDARPPDPLE